MVNFFLAVVEIEALKLFNCIFLECCSICLIKLDVDQCLVKVVGINEHTLFERLTAYRVELQVHVAIYF